MVEAGNNASKLTNQMTAPPEEACKIKVEIRQPESHPIPDSERYRENAVFEGVDKADSEDAAEDVEMGDGDAESQGDSEETEDHDGSDRGCRTPIR